MNEDLKNLSDYVADLAFSTALFENQYHDELGPELRIELSTLRGALNGFIGKVIQQKKSI